MTMALYIRDERAVRLVRELAERKGVTMTQALVEALEDALAREGRPFAERLQEIADEAVRLSDPARKRTLDKQEVDDLWGCS